MNISFNSQNPYSFYNHGNLPINQNARNNTVGNRTVMNSAQRNPMADSFNKLTDRVTAEQNSLSQQMRQMIRTLKQNPQKTAGETLKDKTNGFLELAGSPDAAEEEKISQKEEAVFEERENLMDEALEQMEESGLSASDEMIRELNRMISEFGEEELKELEESMELLESLEVVDPHMSKEDLEDLKRKHRASENKAITKANMEYLKEMIKHEMGKSGQLTAMKSGGGSASLSSPSGTGSPMPQISFMPAGTAQIPSVEMPSAPADGGISI